MQKCLAKVRFMLETENFYLDIMSKNDSISLLETHNSAEHDISVVEVYDLASDIGRECEKIIEEFGPNAVAQLIPKVISALEKLEHLASENERENSVLEELNNKIHCLETEKNEKAEYRKRFEKVRLSKDSVVQSLKFHSLGIGSHRRTMEI